MAADYPAPSDPGKVQTKPKGPHHTLKVCAKGKKGKGCFKSIQKAINAAKPGDTVKVPNGTYKEGVKVTGPKKRYLKMVGNIADPSKVVLDGTGLKGAAASNGVIVNSADNVSIRGFTATHYTGNGFFVTNTKGYKLNDLIAKYTGTYGIYAFNTVGGEMRNDIGAYVNDGAFYIGQTPEQTKPVRSIVSNVVGHSSVIGFSGTNMRYVTITKSKFFNNGVGIVPNALDSEKFAPPED